MIYVIGTGPITKRVKKKCKSDNVNFLGYLDDDEVKIYYHVADIFSFPSYTRSEAFGLALAEAMYCGVVPVTFTIEGSGVNWVCINDITGIEVDKCDTRGYAKALDRLIVDDSLRERYARNGRERIIREFTLEKNISMLLSQYTFLLNL
jgi:glycosyltransferase involved in cell wall biosynthesis